MKLAWMTDIHLNFLGTQQIETWLQSIAAQPMDAVLITGDIGEAPNYAIFLDRMAETLQIPIYFTLGNHDYYHAQLETVRKQVRRLSETNPLLHWLPQSGVISLTDTVALVGHSGWGDAGYGNFMQSSISLSDYSLIYDLASLEKPELQKRLQALGQEAADYLHGVLSEALETHEHVIVGTHVPPFVESAWYEGKVPDETDPYVPHFTCKAVGDLLLELAQAHPERQITVLCGHTHGTGVADIRPNLQVITGGAEYGLPTIQQKFEFEVSPKTTNSLNKPLQMLGVWGNTLRMSLVHLRQLGQFQRDHKIRSRSST